MEFYTFISENIDIDKRIDLYLNEEIENLSRSMIQKLIQKEFITVNGKIINKNYKLKENEFIEVKIPDPEEVNITPQNIKLDVLYEDSEIIVVNKPQGMVVHPAPGHYSDTLVNALMYHCKDNLSGINGNLRPGIVHRIDKDTSGILVAAKTDNAHKSLTMQLASHSMNRIYNAVVYNNFKEDEGTVDAPIGRHPVDRKKMAVTKKNSKDAVTHYKVLKRFEKFCFLELKLETGRTHQIRVHMSYIGHPLLGDFIYGPQKPAFNLKGQALHAKTLGFLHPLTNKYMEFESDLPEYFKILILKLENNKT